MHVVKKTLLSIRRLQCRQAAVIVPSIRQTLAVQPYKPSLFNHRQTLAVQPYKPSLFNHRQTLAVQSYKPSSLFNHRQTLAVQPYKPSLFNHRQTIAVQPYKPSLFNHRQTFAVQPSRELFEQAAGDVQKIIEERNRGPRADTRLTARARTP
ncbi:hypothetical protein DPMN_131003 [Dreissena polymorpha]|uniref:Uncharacterized protein n=1 Tax=Dreissena polymorpha TaxID=45954 RepID=A0A9D4H5Q7_DREPO|nr:hypothetical protein DPMN_131003 [Dreissena polymorpha]